MKSFRWHIFVLPLILFSIFFGKTILFAQDIDPAEVARAIERGVRFLKNKQNADGQWLEQAGSERCGMTALAIIAMRSCGVSKDDPAIQRGLQYLRLFPGVASGRNYSLALETMAFCLVEPERDLPLIRQNVDMIVKNQVRIDSLSNGGWHYSPGSGTSDLSNSQFSVLALYEAERVGVKVNRDVWQQSHRFWFNTQNKDGSWGYMPTGKEGSGSGRGSMTCAGIASLIITSGELESSGVSVQNNVIICRPNPHSPSASKITKGIEWLGKHFSVSQNPSYGGWLYYYLYALERVGRMTNSRFIDEHDWYREGTEKLLQLCDPISGKWSGSGDGEEVATAFALLFLSKGRRPVLLSKVEYLDNSSWNLHPNDMNNLTSFVEKEWKLDLTWQHIVLKHASVDDLLQSPVLYFSGNKTPLPKTDAETEIMAKKLREYVEQGGFIMAEAHSKDESFDSGFRALMQQVFPEPGYELALLEQTHPIWSAEVAIEPDLIRSIEGINFGCRTSVIYVPPAPNAPSLSCLWEVAQIFDRSEPYSMDVQRQIDAGLGIGINILAYATNRELKSKDQVAESVSKKRPETDSRRGQFFLSLLDHGGGSNPAPRAMPNLLQWIQMKLGLPCDSRVDVVDPANPELSKYPILTMHGRGAFQFSDIQRANLKTHLQSGGFLFANSICSEKIFSDSFRTEMQKIFPGQKLEPIPHDDPIFSSDYGGFEIDTLEMRIPEQTAGKKRTSPIRKVVPELFGIKQVMQNDATGGTKTESVNLGSRWVVVFSPNDISCALECACSLDYRGYTEESAMTLGVNILLYAIEHW
ncbi:MAG: DUF4159 domain-containing protein [Thermoguttaceae bacterium]